ncbi:CBS domain-containing protein [Kibdelosporangium banguiense]|uniref:CBS domain-containing protein n=1 Tax=Kibdelosporangium banguiense TaxID=1365924 RepID=A0ABS4TYM0_9PSEU|nr:trypsin-like peptidase domain-containing protein [Kibdelosporangium banguiense]MBP2329503.1 CBS domain-containing protein [Kibdelosporangium banguiense]
MQHSPAIHHTIVAVDIADFTNPVRTELHQAAMHNGLYGVLETAFNRAGVRWEACKREDRGDGVLILVPSEFSKTLVVDQLPNLLVAGLVRYNAVHAREARMQLRMAVHSGEVYHEAEGKVSSALNNTFRILEAEAAKSSLRDTGGVLAMIVSDPFFQDVIAADPATGPAHFQEIPVAVKHARTPAWLRILGTTDDQSRLLPVFPEIALRRLRKLIGTVVVPGLPLLFAQAVGHRGPSVGRESTVWDAVEYLLDLNAEPSGLPRLMTFVELLADELGGAIGRSLRAWNDEQARYLRLGPDIGRLRASADRPVGIEGADRTRMPWRARILSADGRVLGGGVLLGPDHVLTCAHLLEPVGGDAATLLVDFVGLPNSPSVVAHVAVDGWNQPDQAGHGDVALLVLDEHMRVDLGATLHRNPLSGNRSVRVYGFPRFEPFGISAPARLAGGDDEWVLLTDVQSRIVAGFSGGPVVDEETGRLLGIVTGEPGEGASLVRMLPAETIVRYLPRVADWVSPEPVPPAKPVTSALRARILCLSDEPAVSGRPMRISFAVMPNRPTRPLDQPVRLRVLLDAVPATVRPVSRVAVLAGYRTTTPVEFEVVPEEDGILPLVFRVYRDFDSHLLLEISTQLPVQRAEVPT